MCHGYEPYDEKCSRLMALQRMGIVKNYEVHMNR